MFAAAAAAAVEGGLSRRCRSLSLSLLADEGRQSCIVRLVRGCTIQLLRVIGICCARHADDMSPHAVSTFCNLLHTLTVSGHLDDTGTLASLALSTSTFSSCLAGIQCFDAVGWVAGRASSL